MKNENMIEDLKSLTYIDAFDNIDVLKLIISGLIQLDNAKDEDKKWVKFKSNGEKYKHLAYIVEIGEKSAFYACNQFFGINTSGKYNEMFTVQSMIKHYNNLSNEQKRELAQSIVNKEKNPNDVLPRFIYKVLKTINEIYPSEKTSDDKIIRKTKYNMIKDVSGLLVLTKNTLNYIKNYE